MPVQSNVIKTKKAIDGYFTNQNRALEYHHMKDEDVLIFIPARSGSKGVPDKNVRLLGDKPLMAYSIQAGIEAETAGRIVVSTDSEQYAEIAAHYNAEVPFLRPNRLATDKVPMREAVYDLLYRLYVKEGYEPKAICYLIVTYPFKTARDVDLIVSSVKYGALSAHTVSKPQKKPDEIFLIDENNRMVFPKLGGYHAEYNISGPFYVSNMSIVVHSIPPWRFVHDQYEQKTEFHEYYMEVHRYFNRCLLRTGAATECNHAFLADEVRSVDINTEEDFSMAEAIIEENLFDFQGVLND